MGRQLSLATRRELIQAIGERYHSSSRPEKKTILDEFLQVTGYHRKHAIRALKRPSGRKTKGAARPRIYDEAVRSALTILWEAADRICGKRLKEAIPTLVDAMERYGHLQLDTEVRRSVLAVSAATMDRLLKPVREMGKQRRRRSGINNTRLRKSIAVRTFNGWNDPPPGFFEMDMVAHCGKTVAGSHVHSLVLTDIASGWTEAAAMVVREQTLITLTVEEIRGKLSIPMLGLDVDNDSAFINDTVVEYCKGRKIELTRSRAYRKNDQAWIEQKNGSVVRRLVGYGRLEGVAAAEALGILHDVGRLYVNFFLPSFKLKSKVREGAKVTKLYHAPATPYERLLASERVTEQSKDQLRQVFATLDPVELLNRIREAQRKLTRHEVGSQDDKATETSQELSRFVASLSTAWSEGEVRATHRKDATGPRPWRTRVDPFQEVWPLVEQWLNEQPDATAKTLFQRLQAQAPAPFAPGQLRTLQRRTKQWRTEIARKLVIGASVRGGDSTSGCIRERGA
ncbi:MAG: transposase [Bryobacteraceae bacterium]